MTNFWAGELSDDQASNFFSLRKIWTTSNFYINQLATAEARVDTGIAVTGLGFLHDKTMTVD